MNANKFIFLENYQAVSYALECTKINDPSQSLLEPKRTTWSWSSRYFKTGHVIMIKLHENFDFLGAVYMISECLSFRNEFYSSMKFALHSHDEIERLSQRRSGQSRSQRPQSFWSATGMLFRTLDESNKGPGDETAFWLEPRVRAVFPQDQIRLRHSPQTTRLAILNPVWSSFSVYMNNMIPE